MKIVLATGNENKVREIADRLPDHVKVMMPSALGITGEIPETGETLEANALQKAQFVYDKTGYIAIADDTGLEVDALNGAPGVYSARFAGGEKDAEKNMNLLLQKMQGKTNRKARFVTVMALIFNGRSYTFRGVAEGTITTEKRGDQGFGYDPVFLPEGSDRTFGEMTLHEKQKISHRARALHEVIQFLLNQA